jgi:serine/threonine protein kinase, bacterial
VITLTLLHSQLRTPQRHWSFTAKPVIRVGRSPDNDIVMADILVSRHHLEILYQINLDKGNRWCLKSRGVNGTFLDGKLVANGVLTHGSVIQLGPTGPILKVEIKGASTTSINLSSCNHAGNFPGSLFCSNCGQPLNVQRTIRDYLVLRLLGSGGMGTTFLVCNPQTVPGVRPELKVLKEMNAEVKDLPQAQELFEREARVLKSLCHAGVPQFLDYFEEENHRYLVMELIHGQDLDKLVWQQGPVPPAQAVMWMLQVCGVLDYLHNQEPPILHRDLKPSNLLVRSRDKQVVVIDFGTVKDGGNTPDARIAVEGYSAPEQSLGQPTAQSDLYAVGATLIFLLTGKNPNKFYKDHAGHQRFDLHDVPNIPPDLRHVIYKVTEPLVEDRYESAIELAQALKACL